MQFRPTPAPEPTDISVVPYPHGFRQLITMADVTIMTGAFGRVLQQEEKGKEYLLTKHCFELTSAHSWTMTASNSMLVLSYTIEGGLTMQHSLLGALEHYATSVCLYYLPAGDYQVDIPAGLCTTIKLHIDLELLELSCHGHPEMDDLLARVREGCPRGWVTPLVKSRQHSKMLLRHITACTKEGGLRKLYMDQTIERLLELYVKGNKKQQKKGRTFKVKEQHIESLRHAEEKLGKEGLFTYELAKAARRLGMTAVELGRVCDAVHQRKWPGFQKMKRMEEACVLLLTTDKNVSEICYELEYDRPANFSRAFKDEIGCTPEDYRKSKKAD